MIRVWCETCKGTREQLNQNPFNVIRMLCPDCEGKGYTEHEGSLEDILETKEELTELEEGLELGFALHEALSNGYIPIHQGQKVYRINFNIGSTQQYSKELITWYREHKGGTQ